MSAPSALAVTFSTASSKERPQAITVFRPCSSSRPWQLPQVSIISTVQRPAAERSMVTSTSWYWCPGTCPNLFPVEDSTLISFIVPCSFLPGFPGFCCGAPRRVGLSHTRLVLRPHAGVEPAFPGEGPNCAALWRSACFHTWVRLKKPSNAASSAHISTAVSLFSF